ncbi:molecular chaperone, Hsp70 class domain protein [Burkholderia pseudomallei MSHR7500]|nr:molecular chaperone, Hsp70 class domain protein [Burkholderia pseudomallei MSHR7500]
MRCAIDYSAEPPSRRAAEQPEQPEQPVPALHPVPRPADNVAPSASRVSPASVRPPVVTRGGFVIKSRSFPFSHRCPAARP